MKFLFYQLHNITKNYFLDVYLDAFLTHYSNLYESIFTDNKVNKVHENINNNFELLKINQNNCN